MARKPPVDLSVLARRSIDNDLIYPGDVLDVTLVTGAEEETPESIPHRVDEQGNINLPIVGPVHVAGVDMTEAERLIRTASIHRRIYRDPRVSVLLNTRRMDRVRVVGAVVEPGVKDLPTAGNDLLAAIVAAKGLTETAGTIIEIKHPALPARQAAQVAHQPGNGSQTAQAFRVDIIEAMRGNVGDLRLRDGSVVTVLEHVAEEVYVTGLVAKPGPVELPKDRPLRVTQAIAEAGGRKMELANTVHVQRYVEGRDEPVVVSVFTPTGEVRQFR